MTKIFLVLAAVIGVLLCASNVRAQLDPVAIGQGLVLSSTMRAQAERDAARLRHRRGGHSVTKRRMASRLSNASTRFTPSQALRKRTLSQIVAKARAASPQQGAALEKVFAKDPIAAIGSSLEKYGLKTNDVADAATAYLMSAWYGVRGSTEDPPRDKVRALNAQVRRAFLSLPAFASASNAAKQQMADVLLVQTMITDATVQAAKSKPEQMEQAKATVKQGALATFHLIYPKCN